MSETTALAKQVEVIARLKKLGYNETQAAQVVENLLKELRTRPDDDSVVKTLQKVIPS
jgi:Holliday junction resolvasome RuvABC DNA-binding subunit